VIPNQIVVFFLVISNEQIETSGHIIS